MANEKFNRRNFFGLMAIAPLSMFVSPAPINTGGVSHVFHSREYLPPEKVAELMRHSCQAGLITIAEARTALDLGRIFKDA